MNTVSRDNCLSDYLWGNDAMQEKCKGWNLVDDADLSVKLESMPPDTSEINHYHHHAQQFFFVLKGQAKIIVHNEMLLIYPNQGILIQQGEKHKIYNDGPQVLEFILISQPSTANDRINCE